MKKYKDRTSITVFLLHFIGIVFFLFVLCALPTHATESYAHRKQMTICEDNIKLDLLNKIERQTDFYFFYGNEQVNKDIELSINVKNKSISEILDIILAETDADELVTQQEKREIRGRVEDEYGVPIIGANIIEKGTTNGVITDLDGYFVIQVNTDAIISISYIGYIGQDVVVGNNKTLRVVLIEDAHSLDEVVVIGYGTKKKGSLTGSISLVDMVDNESRPITNAQNILYGVPGIYANLNTSQPGVDRAMIRIRGFGTLNNNDPLVLVDGFEYPMSELNPNDIESMTIMKDASAAIYGSKGANGVILVTTKKGKGTPTVEYKFNYGRQSPTQMIDLVWDPIVYMKSLNQAERNEGKGTQTFSEEDLGGYQLGMELDPYNYPANDWSKIPYRTGIMYKNDLSVSGSSDKYNYRFSIGWLDRNGVIFGPGNKEDKYSLGFNSSAKVNDRLELGISMHGYFRTYTQPAYEINNFMSLRGRDLPIQNDVLEDGSYGYPFLRVPGRNNWENARMLAYEGSWKKRIVRSLSTINATYKFPFDINYNIKFGADKYDGLTQRFVPVMYKIQAKTGERQNYNSPAEAPRSYSYDYNTMNLHFYNTLDWEKDFSEHNIGVMIGGSYDYYQNINTAAQMQGYADELLTALNAGTIYANITGNTTEESLGSYFGRLNYSYLDKYLLEGVMRYDGSSRFSSGNRWKFFPGISSGWIISNEDFMRKAKLIDFLKLRASIGELGNQAVALYSYENTVNLGHDYSFGGPNGVLVSGAAATASTDPSTTWEKTVDYNIGVDGAFYKSKIDITLDFYKRLTSGILRTVNLPSQVGNLSGPKSNLGSVSNSGYEFSLGFRDILDNGFGYKIYGNISYNKNRVEDLNGEILYSYNSNLPTITKEGYPMNSFYVLNAIGIFQSDEEVENSPFQANDTRAGYLKYEDVNDDGIINDEDRIIVKSSSIMPDYTYGFGINLSYNGFTLSGDFQGVIGIKTAPVNRPATPLNNGANLSWEWVTESWTEENPNARLPILTEANYSDNFRPSTFLIKDASYLRLKNLQLRYDFSESLLSRINLRALSVFINGENLLTFTKFNLGDPESMYNAIGLSHYPMLKTINSGLSITF